MAFEFLNDEDLKNFIHNFYTLIKLNQEGDEWHSDFEAVIRDIITADITKVQAVQKRVKENFPSEEAKTLLNFLDEYMNNISKDNINLIFQLRRKDQIYAEERFLQMQSYQRDDIQSCDNKSLEKAEKNLPHIVKIDGDVLLINPFSSTREKAKSIGEFLDKQFNNDEALKERAYHLIFSSSTFEAPVKNIEDSRPESSSLIQASINIETKDAPDGKKILLFKRYNQRVFLSNGGNYPIFYYENFYGHSHPHLESNNTVIEEKAFANISSKSLAFFIENTSDKHDLNQDILSSFENLSEENKQSLKKVFDEIKEKDIKTSIINFGRINIPTEIHLDDEVASDLNNVILSYQLFCIIEKLHIKTLDELYLNIAAALNLFKIDISSTNLHILDKLDTSFTSKISIALSADEVYQKGINLLLFREETSLPVFSPDHEKVGYHFASDRVNLLNKSKQSHFLNKIIHLIENISDEERKTRFTNTLLNLIATHEITLESDDKIYLIEKLLNAGVSFDFKKALNLFETDSSKQFMLKVIFKKVSHEKIPYIFKEENKNYEIILESKNEYEYETNKYLNKFFYDCMPVSSKVIKCIEIYHNLYSTKGINYFLPSSFKKYLSSKVVGTLLIGTKADEYNSGEILKIFSQFFSKENRNYSIDDKRTIIPLFFKLLPKMTMKEMSSNKIDEEGYRKLISLQSNYGFSSIDHDIFDSIKNFMLSNSYFDSNSFEKIVKELIDQPIIIPKEGEYIESYREQFFEPFVDKNYADTSTQYTLHVSGHKITTKEKIDALKIDNAFKSKLHPLLQEYLTQKFNPQSIKRIASSINAFPALEQIYTYKQIINIECEGSQKAIINVTTDIFDEAGNHSGVTTVNFSVNLQIRTNVDSGRKFYHFSISDYNCTENYNSDDLSHISRNDINRESIKHSLIKDYNAYVAVLSELHNKNPGDDHLHSNLPDNYYELLNLSTETLSSLTAEDINDLLDFAIHDENISFQRSFIEKIVGEQPSAISNKARIILALKSPKLIDNIYGDRFYEVEPSQAGMVLTELLESAVNAKNDEERKKILKIFDKIIYNRKNNLNSLHSPAELKPSVDDQKQSNNSSETTPNSDQVRIGNKPEHTPKAFNQTRIKFISLLRNNFPERLISLESDKKIILTPEEVTELVCHYPHEKFIKNNIIRGNYLKNKFKPESDEHTKYVISMISTFLDKIAQEKFTKKIQDDIVELSGKELNNRVEDLVFNFGLFSNNFFKWFREISDKDNSSLLSKFKAGFTETAGEDEFPLSTKKIFFDIELARRVSGENNLASVMLAYKNDPNNKESNARKLIRIIENSRLLISSPDCIQMLFREMDQPDYLIRLFELFELPVRAMSINTAKKVDQNVKNIILNDAFPLEQRRKLLDYWLAILLARKEKDFIYTESGYTQDLDRYKDFRDIIDGYSFGFAKQHITNAALLIETLKSAISDDEERSKVLASLLSKLEPISDNMKPPEKPPLKSSIAGFFRRRNVDDARGANQASAPSFLSGRGN